MFLALVAGVSRSGYSCAKASKPPRKSAGAGGRAEKAEVPGLTIVAQKSCRRGVAEYGDDDALVGDDKDDVCAGPVLVRDPAIGTCAVALGWGFMRTLQDEDGAAVFSSQRPLGAWSGSRCPRRSMASRKRSQAHE